MNEQTWGYIILVVGGLAFITYLFFMLRYLFPALIFGSRPGAQREQRQKIVAEVQASGASLATVTCSGQVGGASFRGPLLSLDIRPSGIIIIPTFGATALRFGEIKQLKYEKHFWNRGLVIVHTSQAVQSPIVLYGVEEESPFAQTLNSMIDKG